MEKFTTKSTSLYSAHVKEPIVIYEKENTRRIFIADINDAKILTKETLSGTIVHQRKKISDEWEDVDSINLATLKGGEGIKLHFKSGQLRTFYLGLEKLYKLSEKGVSFGEHEYIVGLTNELMQVPEERKTFIQQLLSKNYGKEIWNELIENNPDLATRLSQARLQNKRNLALNEFKQNLFKDNNEDYWQDFFNRNQWIFGYGLKYCFLSQLTVQPHYGGSNYHGIGNQKGDYLLSSEAEIKFTVLVEIKRPSTKLLAVNKDNNHIEHRNGAWQLSQYLTGGISQIQINCKTWLRKSFEPENSAELNSKNIFTVNPRGILVIGNTKELDNRNKIETFESFRRNISNPEIITIDELYERAKFIVQNEQKAINENFE